MAYRSQLVIRTRDADGARTLERVKELADQRSVTISELALELLATALDGPSADVVSSSVADVGDDEEDDAEVEAAPVADESAVRRDPGPLLPPPSVKPKDPDVRPDEDPEQAAERCIALFGEEGAAAAARALRPYFAAAEPVDGANIREELQERMKKADYDALMEELKQTDEYRDYRRRVVYASW